MFNISTRTRYGILALMELAQNKNPGPVSLSVIAEKQDISLKYLENIFKLLKRNRIVRSLRGPEGGYQLLITPANLTLFQIFDAVEGPLQTVDCIFDPSFCNKNSKCSLKDVLEELQNHIITFLKSKTLKQIIQKKGHKNDQ